MTYPQTLEYLFKQLPMYQREGKTAFKKDLTNTLKLCEILNNPHLNFKSIHIAGTNGKGSTAHMLASIFQEAGYKTGLYTSPHLIDFRERIRINGKMIPKSFVIRFVEQYKNKFEDISPSFFEWTVSLAFFYFAQEKVDIAIIETGLGGRLDSTNIITPVLSIITNIGFDHMDILGNTLQEIAFEKAGIIKPHTPSIVVDSSGVKKVFRNVAKEKNAPIAFTEELDFKVKLKSDLKGHYQETNKMGVYHAWINLRKQAWKISYLHLVNGLNRVTKNTGLRGRWETIQTVPKIIVDTAHNKEGLLVTLHQLKNQSYDKLHIVIGLTKEKNVAELLPLFPAHAQFYFCEATVPRAMKKEIINEEAQKLNLNSMVFNSVKEAFEFAKQNAEKEDLIFVGGSNFVVAEVL